MTTSPAHAPSAPPRAPADPVAALLRRVRSATGWSGASLELVEDLLPTSLAHLALPGGVPVHLPDAAALPRLAANPWLDGRLGSTRALSAVPVLGPAGDVLAVLVARDDAPHRPDPAREAALADLADLAGALLLAGRRAVSSRALGGLAAAVAAADERVALAEVGLADRHDLLEAVLDTVDVGIVVLRADGRVSVLNPVVRAWAGLPASLEPVAAARTATTALYADAVGTVLSAVRGPLLDALAGGPVTAAEVTWASADGTVVVGTCRARALSAGGVLTGAVVSLTDVTAERAARAELERSNTELEGFAGIAAHDLRSPLSVVDGYLEVLEDDALDRQDARSAGWAATARRSAGRMAALLEALLAYAQAGASGSGTPSDPSAQGRGAVLRPVPARALLEAVLADLALPPGARVDLPPAGQELPVLQADPVQLHQLLANLVANAVKFTRPGVPAVVACDVRTRDGAWELVVLDHGPGVPAEHRDSVFRAFERGTHGRAGTAASTAGTTAVPGHGLGLATAQRIVERHRGAIALEETPGGGLTVRVRLPRP